MDERIRQLTEKTGEPITDEELALMLEHIGDERGEIRDGLIYRMFCVGCEEELFSIAQFREIYRYLSEGGLLFRSGEGIRSTLERSFSALTFAVLLHFDDREGSIYYGALSEGDRERLMEDGIRFFETEEDSTGYTEEYGWVHTMAHASELLLGMVRHSSFGRALAKPVLDAIFTALVKRDRRFTDGDEKRIGLIPLALVDRGFLEPPEISAWIRRFDAHYEAEPAESISTFRSRENVLNMLSFMALFPELGGESSVLEEIRRFHSVEMYRAHIGEERE